VYRVHAPAEGYEGEVGAVVFRHGVAEIEAGREVAYFRRRGYRIEEIGAEQAPKEASERPAQSAPKAEWVAYVTATTDLSEAEAANMTKTELAELAE